MPGSVVPLAMFSPINDNAFDPLDRDVPHMIGDCNMVDEQYWRNYYHLSLLMNSIEEMIIIGYLF